MNYKVNAKQKIENNEAIGVLLTPSSKGYRCLGNGTHEWIECCCDECDYYFFCFQDWNRVIKVDEVKIHIKKYSK